MHTHMQPDSPGLCSAAAGWLEVGGPGRVAHCLAHLPQLPAIVSASCAHLRLVVRGLRRAEATVPCHSAVSPWLQVKAQVGLEKPLVCTCAHGARPLRLLCCACCLLHRVPHMLLLHSLGWTMQLVTLIAQPLHGP